MPSFALGRMPVPVPDLRQLMESIHLNPGALY